VCLQEEVGRVEAKLMSLGKVRGVMSGQIGEVIEASQSLVAAHATSRVKVAGPTRGRRGLVRGDEAQMGLAFSAVRQRL
jgi:hypothetical protein